MIAESARLESLICAATVSAPDALFNREYNEALVHQVVPRALLAAIESAYGISYRRTLAQVIESTSPSRASTTRSRPISSLMIASFSMYESLAGM